MQSEDRGTGLICEKGGSPEQHRRLKKGVVTTAHMFMQGPIFFAPSKKIPAPPLALRPPWHQVKHSKTPIPSVTSLGTVTTQ